MYLPTRFEAQADAFSIVFQTKFYSNGKSIVGIMTINRKGVCEVSSSSLIDIYAIMVLTLFLFMNTVWRYLLLTGIRRIWVIHGVHIAADKIGGYIDFQTTVAVAQLALKNKNFRQRIIVFVAVLLDR